MSDSIRSFIAIDLNNDIHLLIKSIQDHLKKTDADVKWINPQNCHLTLKFLGPTPQEEINSIKKILMSLSIETKSISTEIHGLGCFPDVKKPNIVWIGLTDENKLIESLAGKLDIALNKLGFEKEKRSFKPHITIGRVRSSNNLAAFITAIENFSFPFSPMTLEKIIFYKSTLTPSGPIYEVLAINSINLKDEIL